MIRYRTLRRLLASLLLASSLASAAPAAFAANAEQTEDVKKLLEQYHLSKPSDDSLNEGAIQGMVQSLGDPYTEYFSDDQWKQFQNYLEQTYVGVGIVSARDEGRLYVQDVVPNGPAAKAGILPGDAIASVDGQDVRTATLDKLNRLISGKEGTTVRIVVVRGGKTHAYSLTRHSVQLPAASSTLLRGGVGYLSLTAFRSDAADKFKAELDKLDAKGIRSLIVDLRDNGGGYVEQARLIAENFVSDGVLAHMTDRDGKDNPIELHGTTKPYPVYLLVNDNTASASELLSGALQDYGVAKLIGTPTYGKGVVQQIVEVPSGGILKVTIEEYYTPSGHKVDHKGLMPDYLVEGETMQLLAAIRQAGGKPAAMTAGKGSVVIDGIRTAAASSVVARNGVPFVDLKLAAAFAGGTVRYEAATKTIAVDIGGKTNRIPASDAGLYVRNGVSAVDVRLLSKWQPGLKWSSSDGLLRLTAA